MAVVIAFGVSLYVGMGSSRLGLQRGAERFFAQQRLADVFVSLARAPLSVAARVEAPKSPGRTRERAAHAAR